MSGDIEYKIKEAVLEGRMEYVIKRTDDHEARLRLLEKAHWKMTGITALAAALATFAAAWVSRL
jgi:hypothetical protein